MNEDPADHPMFERFVRELSDPNNALLATTLKCHICIEEGINRVLNAYFPAPLPLKALHLEASQKLLLLQSILPKTNKDRIVLVFEKLNQLRNGLAHSFDSNKVQERLTGLVAAYREHYLEQLPLDQRTLPDSLGEQITLISAHALGDLCGLERELQQFREQLNRFNEAKSKT
jgi:hypothetical protein